MNEEDRLDARQGGAATSSSATWDRTTASACSRSPTSCASWSRSRRSPRTARALQSAVSGLFADGGTAFYEASVQAFQTVRDLRDRERINAVVLLTDGEDTDSSIGFEDALRRAAGPGRLARPGAPVHDRLQRRARPRRAASSTSCARPPAASATRARRATSRPCTAPSRPSSRTEACARPDKRPYSRGEFNRALIVNALLDPFNVGVLAVDADRSGSCSGCCRCSARSAPSLYLGAAPRAPTSTRTSPTRCSRASAGSAASALERAPAAAGREAPHARRSPGWSPRRACASSASARRSTSADLPYDEVADEVDRFVAAMEDDRPARAAARRRARRHAAGRRRGAPGRRSRAHPDKRELAERPDDPAADAAPHAGASCSASSPRWSGSSSSWTPSAASSSPCPPPTGAASRQQLAAEVRGAARADGRGRRRHGGRRYEGGPG